MKKNLKIFSFSLLIALSCLFLYSCSNDSVVNTITQTATTGKFSKTYGGNASDMFTSMAPVSSGGYITGGYTVSSGAGDNDFLITRLSASLDVVWSKTYGSTGNDQCNAVKQTADGGFILVGETNSFGAEGFDIYVIKTNADGNVIWQNIYKATGDQYGNSVVQDLDGNLFITGYSNENPSSTNDVLVLKLASDGSVLWQKLYGGPLNDYAYKIIRTSDGGFLTAGSTFSFSAAAGDIYLLKLKSDGTFDWSNTYGSAGFEQANDVIECSGSSDLMVAGYTTSFGLSTGDAILFKTDHLGVVYNTTEQWPRTIGSTMGHDEANSVIQQSDGSFCITGSFSQSGTVSNILFTHYFGDGVYDYSRSYGTTGIDKGITLVTKSDGFIIGGVTSSVGAGSNDYTLIGMKSDSSKYNTCLTDNIPAVAGGSPTINHVPALTQNYTAPDAVKTSVTSTVSPVGITSLTGCSN